MHHQVLDLQVVKMGKRFYVFSVASRYDKIASFIHPNLIPFFMTVFFLKVFEELHFLRNGQLF